MTIEELGWQTALNEQQRAAVSYLDGPSLVIAGAGSGKTRVLTYKVAYLLHNGVSPWNILALTFTNKAAREMNRRIAELVDEASVRHLWSGTFHSVFLRILHREAEAVGLRPDFSIYDTTDSRSLLKAIVKEKKLDDKVYKPSLLHARISEAKNRLLLPAGYQADASIHKRDAMANIPEAGEIYRTYCERLCRANALDFDDLLLFTFLLLRDHPDICRKYKERFPYILVDEYQDTNYAQHSIVRLLTDADSCICVVGDDAQSIYGFRGADIEGILNFTHTYPAARLIKLECNYRSTQNIVEAANCIIRHNTRQIEKRVYAAGTEGGRLRLLSAYSDKEEALKVTAEIRRLRRYDHVGCGDIAVLYRTNAQSRSFEEALRAQNIPYRVYGSLSFYQRKEIKDVIAYFRLICNLHDEESFRRVVNYPARGIGQTTLSKLQGAAAEGGVPVWEVAVRPEAYGVALSRSTQARLAAFCGMVEAWRAQKEEQTASLMADRVLCESGIAQELQKDKSVEAESARQNLDELLGAIRGREQELLEEQGEAFLSLQDYLSQVALLSETEAGEADTEERVSLMTVHAAKGLEFDTVFVTGLEDGLFPADSARYLPREMEEERRLFYVAVTRACQRCYLTYARSRFKWGKMESFEPSPFLAEIDRRYIEQEAPGGFGARPVAEAQRPAAAFVPRFAAAGEAPVCGSGGLRRLTPPGPPAAGADKGRPLPSGLRAGAYIIHERFGRGRVTALEGTGENSCATVEFESAGTKKLLLKFARFQVVE